MQYLKRCNVLRLWYSGVLYYPLILFKRDYDTPLPFVVSTLGFLFLLRLNIFCGVQHGGQCKTHVLWTASNHGSICMDLPEKGPGPSVWDTLLVWVAVCFSDLWSKRITQLNIQDYHGVISRFHVWMHAGVSWDAAYQPSESWTTDIFNWKKTFRNIFRIFSGCCNWVIICYLLPIIREPETPLIYFQLFNPCSCCLSA